MPRKARIQYPGALYHVFNRGIDRRDLFWDDRDRVYFLECLAFGIERFMVEVHAYCLMPNHFHLLVGTPLGNLSHFMQSVQTRYGGHFNIRHERSGYVFQGPYRAKLVEGDRYLLALSRYIHLNAVQPRRHQADAVKNAVKELRAYAWSSYREYIGLAKRKEWMTYAAVEEHVRGAFGNRAGAYRDFVERGLVEQDEDFQGLMESGKAVVASEEFTRRLVESRPSGDHAQKAAFGRVATHLPVNKIMVILLSALGIDPADLRSRRGAAWTRGVAAEMVCTYGGLTHTAAAGLLGLRTGSAVCIRRKILREQRKSDMDLDRQVRKIETELLRLMGRQG